MEFQVDTYALQCALKAIGAVARGLDDKLHIQTKEDSIILSTSSKALGLSAIINSGPNEPGISATPVVQFKTFVSSFMPLDTTTGLGAEYFRINLDKDPNITTITTHKNKKVVKGKLKLKVCDPFSIRTPIYNSSVSFDLEASVMSSIIDKVSYAIDPSETKAIIQGMYINFTDSTIAFAGTNGKIVSEYVIPNTTNISNISVVLRHDFILGLRSLLPKSGLISMSFEDDTKVQVTIVTNDITMYYWGYILNGSSYPDYVAHLNKFSHSIVLDKTILFDILSSIASSLDPDDTNRMTIEIKDRILKIYNDNAQFEYAEEVDYGDEFVIDINGIYLKQTISNIKDDSIIMKFSNSTGCIIFDAVSEQNRKSLLAPLRRR